MVYSALAADPAIAAAYAMLDKSNPLEAASHLVSAYLDAMPLKRYDRAAILPLAIARLCMSVCFAAHNASAKPDDPYQLVKRIHRKKRSRIYWKHAKDLSDQT